MNDLAPLTGPAGQPFAPPPPPPAPLARLPDTDAGTWDVMGAAWKAETVRTDAWDYAERQSLAIASGMFDLLSPAAQARVQARRYGYAGALGTFQQLVLGEAARERHQDPQLWAPYPSTQDELRAQVDAQRRTSLEEAQRVLDQPGGGVAEFLGSAARDVTDQASLAMMPLGASGSALRVIASEALLGGLGNLVTLPREDQVADELGLPRPDPVTRVIEGAAFGGGLAGLALGAVKGFSMWSSRRAGVRDATPKGGDKLQTEIDVNTAEARLRGDQTVQEHLADKTAGALPAVPPDAPPAWARIRNGIFAGESGGDYDALFGFSNRSGGPFEGVKVTEMTVDDALAFSDPSSPYALWVNGQIGRVATPMGAYQVVGTTLRAAKKGLGLTGKELMTPDLQERIGFWIYRNQGTDAWAGYHGPRDDAGPQMPYIPTTRGYTGEGQVSTGDGTRVDVRYEVVDATSLLRASGDLQPRDRTRSMSDVQIADTAARLDPQQLMPNANAAHGAPVVGPDNMIESGNGRTAAIQRAYELHPDRAAAYRAQIEAAGFAVPEGVTRPVLIARRTSPMTPEERVRFAIDAQDSGVAAMTPTEVARASGRAMTAPVLGRLDPAVPLSHEANAGFVRDALAGLPRSARNAMIGSDGLLNKSGERQLREALFARAWSDPDIIELFAEGEAGPLKSLLEALNTSAPAWAALKADIEAGLVRPEMDISGHVLDAMRLVATARKLSAKEGLSIADAVRALLDETDLLDGAISPLTAALVGKFWRNGRAAPAEEIAGFLTRYADDARKAGAVGGMFDGPTSRDVLAAIDPERFGKLPEDLGEVRGFATPPDVRQTADPGFNEGAASLEAEAADAEIAESMSPPEAGSTEELQALVGRGASRAEIDSHPAVLRALAEMKAKPQTADGAGYGDEAWHAARPYRIDGREITGTEAALPLWERQAEELAWREAGLVPAPVARDRRLTIVLGPPAAGKSGIAAEIALAGRAAILDADELKKSLPEFDGGLGAAAVHEESSDLARRLQGVLIGRGTNVVMPKVGDSAASIEKIIALYRKGGYHVSVVNMAVTPENAYRRMIGRFVATGRLVPPDYLDKVGARPSLTYRELKAKGAADGYAEIDNNAAPGQPRAVTDREGVDPLGDAGRAVGPGGEQRPDPRPGSGSDGGAGSGQDAQGLSPAGPLVEGATGWPVAPAKAARVQSIVDSGAGAEVSTRLNALTAAEAKWLKSEYAAGRLERQADPWTGRSLIYRRPVDGSDARWQRAQDQAPAPARRGPVAQAARDLTTKVVAVVSPDAAAARVLDDLHAEFGNLELQLADGSSATVAEVLDDLKSDAGFDAFLQACAIIPGAAP